MELPQRMTGACQCGACRYVVDGPPLLAYVCHCLECRRQTGSAFAASMLVKADEFSIEGPVTTWLRDNENGPPMEVNFCSQCGVRLFHHSVPHEPVMRVRVGTLDDASWFRPAAEFFASRRFPWASIGEDTHQIAERPVPDDYQAIFAAWQRLQEA